MAEIVVVGAGVIGLTTALTLQERGHSVRVIGAATGASITSSVAGAIWFPFRAEPRAEIGRWASVSRRWLTDVASQDPRAGVDVLRVLELDDQDRIPWWGAGIEDLRLIRRGTNESTWGDAAFGWSFTAPRIDPRHHMVWLESRLTRPIEGRRLGALAEAFDVGPRAGDTATPAVVVNCTGLASRALCGDAALRPLYGQVVVVPPDGIDLSVSMADERRGDEIFYVVPRRDEVVIGGCTLAWERPFEDGVLPMPDPAIRERMLARAARYGVRPTRVLRDVAGLRPYRSAVRVERDGSDPRIIHNYGHGGSGYTIARGCAEDVAGMIERGP